MALSGSIGSAYFFGVPQMSHDQFLDLLTIGVVIASAILCLWAIGECLSPPDW